MAVCNTCGFNVVEGAKFCAKCGTAVVNNGFDAGQVSQPNQETQMNQGFQTEQEIPMNQGFQPNQEAPMNQGFQPNQSIPMNQGFQIGQGMPVNNMNAAQGLNFDFSNNTTAFNPVVAERYEYKVLTQKDKWFTGKFDPMMLERAMNAYAQQGWRVIACSTADIPGWSSNRQEFITVLERKIQ